MDHGGSPILSSENGCAGGFEERNNNGLDIPLRPCGRKVRPMAGWFKAWAEGRRDDAQGGLQLGEDVGDVGLVEGRERKALLAEVGYRGDRPCGSYVAGGTLWGFVPLSRPWCVRPCP